MDLYAFSVKIINHIVDKYFQSTKLARENCLSPKKKYR